MKKQDWKNDNNFSFKEVIDSIVEELNQRSKDMIAKRFGFSNKKNMTLSQIGDDYGITRERVRQIIQESINKIKNKAKNDRLFVKAEEMLKFTVNDKYGIISIDELIKSLSKKKEEENFIKFILFCSEDLEHKVEKKEFEEAVVSNEFDLRKWKYIRDIAKETLEEQNRVLSSEIFFDEFFKKDTKEISKEEFFNLINVSSEIKQNVFGNWGMYHWKEINPKSIKEKAYLVIQETKKPLHFKEVANLIDKYNLNKKKSHPQTVHNELIKDDKFVLIGRGTYALNEWGYEQGTVKEVIENILKNNQKSLHQNEIVERVLEVRNVKPTTVVINLNNFFKKTGKQQYFLKRH